MQKIMNMEEEKLFLSLEEWEAQQEWYDFMDWLVSKGGLPKNCLSAENVFEEWKLNGKPKAGL